MVDQWLIASTFDGVHLTFTDTGLQCGTTYAYRVWAWNGAGTSAKTNEAGQTTTACP